MCVQISFSGHCLFWYLACRVFCQGTGCCIHGTSEVWAAALQPYCFSVFFILVKISSYWRCRYSLWFEKWFFSDLIFNDNLLINQFLTNTKIKTSGFLKLSEGKNKEDQKGNTTFSCNQHLLNWFNVHRRQGKNLNQPTGKKKLLC